MIYTEDDMHRILNALDIYGRIFMGQYDSLRAKLRFNNDEVYENICNNEKLLEDLFMSIRHKLLPEIDEYGFYGSYGIFSPAIDKRAAIAYNMQQVFRYTLAYYKHPNGGVSVDFKTPLRAENDPYPFPKAECFTKDDIIYIGCTIEREQFNVITEALAVDNAIKAADITRVFSYYTDLDLPETKKIDEVLHENKKRSI